MKNRKRAVVILAILVAAVLVAGLNLLLMKGDFSNKQPDSAQNDSETQYIEGSNEDGVLYRYDKNARPAVSE